MGTNVEHGPRTNPFLVVPTADGQRVKLLDGGNAYQAALYVKAHTQDGQVKSMLAGDLAQAIKRLNELSEAESRDLGVGDTLEIAPFLGRPEPPRRQSPSFQERAREAAKNPIDPAAAYSVASGDTYWNIAGRLMDFFPEDRQKVVEQQLMSYFSTELKAGVTELDMPAFLGAHGVNVADAGKPPVDPAQRYSPVAGDGFYSIARRLKAAGQFGDLSDGQLVAKLQGYFGENLYPGVAIDIPGFIRDARSGQTSVSPAQPAWVALGGKGPPPPSQRVASAEYGRTFKLSNDQISGLMDQAMRDPGVEVPKAMWMKLVATESSGRPYVPGRDGEIGLTQLMPNTARGLGLEVSEQVDERFDPLLNLKASGRYLTRLKKRFGTWEDALVAYNTGPTRFARGDAPQRSFAYSAKIMGGQTEYARY